MPCSRSRLVRLVLVGPLLAGTLRADGTWLGSSYCLANPNSTGAPTAIGLFGPDHAGTGALYLDDPVVLSAGPVPEATVGLFLAGQLAAQVPFGQGYLCIGGPVHRLPVTGGSGSVLSASLVFDQHPAFAPGDWKLQAGDVAEVVVNLLEMDKRALASRVELRPSEPRK